MGKIQQTVVLGGGISGLAAAYYSLKLKHLAPLIIEGSERCGGWIKSTIQPSGTIFEQGARTLRPRGPAGANTLELVEQLNLESEIVPIPSDSPAAKNRMIYANGALHTLPSSILGLFVKRSPFSKALIWQIANDIFAKAKRQPNGDESIYSFAERRFSKEVADYLISPMICGISGGDAKEVSVRFLMGSLFEKEQSHGSIFKGMLAGLFGSGSKDQFVPTKLYQLMLHERWSIYSFRNGIETLPKSLERYLLDNQVDIRLNTKCQHIEFRSDGVYLNTNQRDFVAQRLISSIPANNLSQLLKHSHPELANLLRVKTVSLAVVNLEFDGKIIQNDAFGLLVAPKENRPILGIIYDTCCFPRENKTVITVMMGGAWFEKRFGSHTSEDDFYHIALEQAQSIMGFSQKPQSHKVNILQNCIPQYVVGHHARIQNLERYIKMNELPVALCGSSYYGVGVNDVILSAKNSINKLL